MQKVSRALFIGIILFIIAAADVLKPNLGDFAQLIGLDIPMTPFTADMTLMLSKDESHEAYYTKNFLVIYQTGLNDFYPLKVEELGWYEFKAPFQWWSECFEAGRECPMVLYYLCRAIEDKVKSPILSWKIEALEKKHATQIEGLGVEFQCPVR